MRYVLRISSYVGVVPGAIHFRGWVEGEHPKPCHGHSTHFNAPGHRGKLTCEEGHELPKQIAWNVEAAWTRERYERYAALHFDGPGPEQFASKEELITVATERFLGALPRSEWEDAHWPEPEQGDRLYLGYVPAEGQGPEPDGYGSLLATRGNDVHE